MTLEAASTLTAADFDYALPPELIAQAPAEPRDSSRLLILPVKAGPIQHRVFSDIVDYLRPGDLLVANRSRVIPARIAATRPNGGAAEVLLLHRLDTGRWEALVRPGRRIHPGSTLRLTDDLALAVHERTPSGGRIVEVLGASGDPDAALAAIGVMPLPPYIHEWRGQPERYQTVYADEPGSVAAPTAGLHVTPALLERLRQHGVFWATLTLHVGLDTFRPLKSDNLAEHTMHRELVDVPASVIRRVHETKQAGGRVIALGTTSVRALESAARWGNLDGWRGWTDLFITPGYTFKAIDGLITNFHLPRSTLLMLVSALVGRERLLDAYQQAIAQRYRFYSFGDAMLIA